MKKLFLTFILSFGVVFAQSWNYPGVSSGYGLIYDAAITSSNDTVNSGWVNIGDAPEVFLTFAVNDSAYFHFDVQYRTGGDEYATFRDSLYVLDNAGGFLTYKLRGHQAWSGAAATLDSSKVLSPIDRIPAANQIRLYYYRSKDTNVKINAVTHRLQARVVFKK